MNIKSNLRTNISNKILNVIQNSDKPVLTLEIGSKINRSWHSLQNYCLKLKL